MSQILNTPLADPSRFSRALSRSPLVSLTLALLVLGGSLVAGRHCTAATPGKDRLRAGAHVVGISPTRFAVIVNAMFTKRSVDKLTDPLLARSVVLEDSSTRLASCVVDSCMVPLDLINRAKKFAAQATGIATGRVIGSAAHTHSAPSARG